MKVIEGELVAESPKNDGECEASETEGAGAQIPAGLRGGRHRKWA